MSGAAFPWTFPQAFEGNTATDADTTGISHQTPTHAELNTRGVREATIKPTGATTTITQDP